MAERKPSFEAFKEHLNAEATNNQYAIPAREETRRHYASVAVVAIIAIVLLALLVFKALTGQPIETGLLVSLLSIAMMAVAGPAAERLARDYWLGRK